MSSSAQHPTYAPTIDPLRLLKGENDVLLLVATKSNLSEVLDRVATITEELIGNGVLCSILLLNDSGTHLLHGAAPHLPSFYNDAINGLAIGNGVGSCGTAAALGREVTVEDIDSHPYWRNFRELAAEAGLRSCWSTPIMSAEGRMLGTFALYHTKPSKPTAVEQEVVRLFNRTAGIAIERAAAGERTKRYQERIDALHEIGLAINSERDLQAIVQKATDAATKVSGAQFGAFFYNDLDENGEKYMLYTISGVPREHFSKFPMPRNTAVFAPTFKGERIVRSPDITREPEYGKNDPHFGMPKGHLPVRSYLAVPVKDTDGTVVGGMFFGHSAPAVFGETAEKIAAAIAAQAAVAITNAGLNQRVARQLRAYEVSQQRLTAAHEIASLATWEWDAKDRSVQFGVASSEIFGRTIREIRSLEDWISQVHAEDREVVRQRMQSVLEHGTTYAAEYRVVKPNGSLRWLQGHGRPERDSSGSVVRVIGVTMDVTERKQQDETLAKAEQKFKLVLASTQLGFWYCDLPFDKLQWDERVKDHFWLPKDADVTIKTFYDCLHPEDRERTRLAIQRSIQEREPYDIDYRTVSPHGEIKWIRAVGSTSYSDDGLPQSFNGITMDVTERRRAEEALRKSEKLAATGRLAATIAHEINNPLEAVTNFIYLARSSENLDEEVRQYLHIADQELSRVTHIAQHTLGFYRESSGPKRVDLCEVVEGVVSIYRRKLEYKQIDVVIDCARPLEVIGLAGELRQVVSNIVANAIDAQPEYSQLRVRGRSVRRNGVSGVRLTFVDQGPGIPHNVRQRIYDPFFTTKKEVGTGLGLWVTKSIVENHGGRIQVRTRTVSPTFTVFSVFLPLAAARMQASIPD